MSGTSGDPLEIIDDPSELIAQRQTQMKAAGAATSNGSSSSNGKHSNEHSHGTVFRASSWSRPLPPLEKAPKPAIRLSDSPEFSPPPYATATTATKRRVLPPGFEESSSSKPSSSRQVSRERSVPQPPVASSSSSSSGATNNASSRVWMPPPRPWEKEAREKAASLVNTLQNGHDAIPTIGGSGARVPNRFLDAQGQVSQRPPSAIDLTLEDDDEPQFISARGDVLPDEVKNNGPVCIGCTSSIVLCLYGMPAPIATENVEAATQAELDRDPLWSRANWPSSSHWWTAPGYRPVVIRPRTAAASNGQSNQWQAGGHNGASSKPQQKIELAVSVVLSPAFHARRQARDGVPPERQNRNMIYLSPFGALADKATEVFTPLLANGLINLEARCKLVQWSRREGFIHHVEMLVFCKRPQVSYVSEILSRAGIALTAPLPGQYYPDDYKGSPPLVLSHGAASVTQAAQLAERSRYHSSFLGGGGSSGMRIVQSKEMTEEERKKQIESVYDELIAGEDLPLADPPKELISAKLFPHQRQGLSFLLEREKERSFDDAGDADSREGKRQVKDSVGLWKVRRSHDGNTIRAYHNVVTGHEQEERPEICRGAILADDMGLGKTITVISTIAATFAEARAFGKASSDRGANGHAADRDDSDDDTGISAMASLLQGSGANKKAKGKSPKKPGKRKTQANDIQQAQRDNLATRTRATLIVCPLTIVSNWEEQVKEHWSKERPPKVYIYHGPNRSSDPLFIAKHDLVMTTYSTLGSEFANQRTWVGQDEQDDDNEDEDDEFQMVDERGDPLSADGKKKKGKTKRKRTDRKEAVNPLQRIEWFRVVLDESHTIKESRTMQCRAVCNLSAQRRLSLTGTPVQNRLDDLYSQIRFLRLDPFGDRLVWNEHCGQRQKKASLNDRKGQGSNEPIEQVALVKIQTIMKFLTLRRTKESKTADGRNILELPRKALRTTTVQFDTREQAQYIRLHEKYKEDFEIMQEAGTVGNNYATILQEISNLRMCCDHPGLVDASKDMRRKRDQGEGTGDHRRVGEAIRQDGLTRDRAAELFTIFSESAMAECQLCETDLGSFAEDAAGGATALEDGDEVKSKPVVTKCSHLFCSACFGKAVGARWRILNRLKADEKTTCPHCSIELSIIMDSIQLEASDIAPQSTLQDEDFDWRSDDEDKKDFTGKGRARNGFGVDRGLPIEDRANLSTKIRYLLADLIPFSACNPGSVLYDPEAPQLDHGVVDEEALRSGQASESVELIQTYVRPKDYRPVKSVVFSQWTTMLDRVQDALHRAGIKFVRLDGKMRRADRAIALDRFKSDPSVEVFLISLRAGGFGLNLVSAARAYLLEPAWNPALEAQAGDRIHRLGQERPVVVTKLVTKDSIEERMILIQKRKQDLANKVGEKRSKAQEKDDRREELQILLGHGGPKKR